MVFKLHNIAQAKNGTLQFTMFFFVLNPESGYRFIDIIQIAAKNPRWKPIHIQK
jgi:hypothetical protein